MTDRDPFAALTALLDDMDRVGDHPANFSQRLLAPTVRLLAERLRAALAEAREALGAIVDERDELIDYWAKAASNALYDVKTERKRAEKAEAERESLRRQVAAVADVAEDRGYSVQKQRDRAERAEAECNQLREALARVEAVCEQVEHDDRESLNRYGQHLPGSVVCVAEMVRDALAQPATDEEAGE